MEPNLYTKGLPTEPGIYWNYGKSLSGRRSEFIIEVFYEAGKLSGAVYKTDPVKWGTGLDSFGPYWAGPICKPEAPEVAP